MLNNSLPEYIFIRTFIIIFHSIGPLCTAYTVTLARRVHLQKDATHPPLRRREERRALFDKVRSEIHDPRKFIEGWFRGAKIEDIGRAELKDFLSWAFWEGRNGKEDEDELEDLVLETEQLVNHKFTSGNGKATSIRLTLDPIEMECRSLLWYTIIMLVDTICHARLLWSGHKYYMTMASALRVFPPRPLAALTASGISPAKVSGYWLRPHTSTTRLPVVFLHGIGIGLYPSVSFLQALDYGLNHDAADDDKVGILSLEQLSISNRLTHAIPKRAESLKQITQILDYHGFHKFVLVGHSFGSVLSTHILNYPPLASRVASTLLMDPVTILLHMPDVAYNFTARKPKSANEWQLFYFASRDPMVAHTLGRHFFWSENLLWRERITELVQRGLRMTVSLARRDLIVDTAAVGTYLTEGGIPDPVMVKDDNHGDGYHMELDVQRKNKNNRNRSEKQDDWRKRLWTGKKGLEIIWWDELDHAQVFNAESTRRKLVDVVVEYVRGK
ncbi:hypothetical protein M433DRAFT_398058 [Acidomyces richmondensis BFW]|nr:MAG: hypothetical protein FE78DRAFT_292279 [Acidomyces sp. 'richmondensis']KYG48660.1 hypothetical protein M433DRAFT_398058 [Acidomyces richmondensis BFW]